MTRSSTRGAAVLAAAALMIGGGLLAAPARAAAGGEVPVIDASFTWGISGYAQVGVAIFGPWRIKDLQGDVVALDGASQTEYVLEKHPVTSLPTTVTTNANAVKFTGGTGVVDREDGRLSISWTGSYALNGYPASINAPDEVFTDPQLEVIDGDAKLSFEVSVPAAVDMSGDPTDAVNLGRVDVLVASDVDVEDVLDGSAWIEGDYKNVEIDVTEGTPQDRTCAAPGWWGSWPEGFVSGLPGSVQAHYYSTGCGMPQESKAPLPVFLTFSDAEGPVLLSQPTGVSGVHGNLRTFSVEVDGSPAPVVKWQFRAAGASDDAWTTIQDISRRDVVGTTYHRALKVSDNGGHVRAMVSNVVGTVYSNPASVSVASVEQATVVVEKTEFYNDRTSEVVVSGSGFLPELATGTRAPFLHQSAGVYVAFGKFADEWRPSTGAQPSTRNLPSGDFGKGVGFIWAVPYEEVANGDSAYGFLDAEGNFEVKLQVNEEWLEDKAGNYGIYTYPGSGGDQPAYETYTPIRFIAAPPVPTFTSAPQDVSVAVGSTAKFTVDASGADTIQWQSRTEGGAWADIEGATAASFETATTSVAQSGTQYRALATNDGGASESLSATLTVTQATPGVKIAVKKNFRFASKTNATVTVGAPAGVAATGAVTIKAGKTVVGKGAVKGGKAVVTLTKKLRPGKANLTAEFVGNADLTAAKSPVTKVTVKKAAAKVTAKLAKKKVRAGKRATVRVKVTARGVKPKGKVRVVVTQGKTKVRTLTVRVKGGTFTKVRLPRLAKGTYRVKATYQGSKTVTKKSTKKITLRVR